MKSKSHPCRWPVALAGAALALSPLSPLAAEKPSTPAVRFFRVPDRSPVLIDLLAYASDRDGDSLTCEEPLASAMNVPLTRIAECVLEYGWQSGVDCDQLSYRVIDATGQSSVVSSISISDGTCAPTAPAGPTGATAVATSSTAIALSWYDQSNNEASFEVSGRQGTGSFIVLASLPPNTQSFTHAATPGSSWEFFVEACNAVGCTPSATATATTPAGSNNHLPAAQDDSGADLTVAIGGSITITKARLLANDTDADLLDALRVIAPTGTITTPKGELRELAGGAIGGYVYRHTGGSAGSDSFAYTITDGEAQDSATVSISIVNLPSPVVAVPDSFTTTEGVPLYIRFDALLGNDSGPGRNVNLLGFSKPSHGRIDFCCHAQFPGPPEGLWYLPENGNSNAATFQYSITGSNGSVSAAEVTITIAADAVSPDPTQAFPNKSITQVLVDANGELTPGASSHLVLTFSDLKRGRIPGPPAQLAADLGDLLQFRLFEIQETGVGDVTSWITPYVPYTSGVTPSQWSPKDYEGAFVFSRTIPDANTCTVACYSNNIKYRLRGADLVASPWTPFTIEFKKPSATGISVAALPDFGPSLRVPEGERLTISTSGLLQNDVFDPAQSSFPFNVSLLGQPVWGSFEGNPATTWTSLFYRAPANYRGVDHFAYTITPTSCAGSANEWQCSSMARAVIEILPGAPVAAPDAVAAPFETGVRFQPLANDTDPQGQLVRVVGINIQPQHGAAILEPTGSIVYTPARNYSGPDTLRYRIEDPWGNQATADVTFTVGPRPNRPPVAVDDSASIETGSGPFDLEINVLGNDSDPDPGTVLQVTSAVSSLRGVTITINPDGTLHYAGEQPLADTFTYTISDGQGGTAQATVFLNLVPCPVCT